LSPASERGDAVANRTRFLAFAARQPFQFRQGNAAMLQRSAGGTAYTSSDLFLREMIAKHPEQFRVIETQASFPCVPVAEWSRTELAAKRILFLLPSQALGGNVATILAVAALQEHRRPAEIGVACTRSTTDLYKLLRGVTIHPYWIDAVDVDRYDAIFDLGHIEARRDIEIWPVDMEGEILRAFEVPPAARFAAEARPVRAHRPRIGIFPLGSSPLRSFPPETTVELARALQKEGAVTIFLNRAQLQGRLAREAIERAKLSEIRIIDGFGSIGELARAIERVDYGVFADSGPAHIAKLFGTPGMAVYTSAPGDVLQGRFRNLGNWQVTWQGAHCAAPCGLAKLRQDCNGRFGCMGSLGLPLADLPSVATGVNPAVVEELFLRAPVPCVAALKEQRADLAAAVMADLLARRADKKKAGS
jgi:ADP-heptose:LPS heptosyltransferase